MPVCAHDLTHRPGLLFLSGDEQATISGWGRAPLFTSAGAGTDAASRRQLIQREPERPGRCRLNRYIVRSGRFRKGTVSNLGCKQHWEKLCVYMGFAFKIWGEFSTLTNKADIHSGIKGTGAAFEREAPPCPFYPQMSTHFFSVPSHALRVTSQWVKTLLGIFKPLLFFG